MLNQNLIKGWFQIKYMYPTLPLSQIAPPISGPNFTQLRYGISHQSENWRGLVLWHLEFRIGIEMVGIELKNYDFRAFNEHHDAITTHSQRFIHYSKGTLDYYSSCVGSLKNHIRFQMDDNSLPLGDNLHCHFTTYIIVSLLFKFELT